MNRLLFLVGCTASGKKRIARQLQAPLNAALLSLDSIKVYEGMDRGTDKVPGSFALTDLVPPDQRYSVGDYVRHATIAVEAIRQGGQRPLFVGGTGLYLRALVRGLFEGPEVPETVRQELVRRYETEGAVRLHGELRRIDPRSADRIHPNDKKRVVRALSVTLHTGHPLSQWQEERTQRPMSGPVALVGIRWPAEVLRDRIEIRVNRMLGHGLIQEVKSLREADRLGPVAAEAIGYREVLDHLAGNSDLATCRQQIITHTWQFSRRQENWFRQFPEIQWVDGAAERSDEEAISNDNEDRLIKPVLELFRASCSNSPEQPGGSAE